MPPKRTKKPPAPPSCNAGTGLESLVQDASSRTCREDPRYLTTGPLGGGGLCDVVAAVDLLLIRHGEPSATVALKGLKPEFRDNPVARQLLIREFLVLRRIAHPGVVRVFDLHESGPELYLVMEKLEGKTLHETLRQRSCLPLQGAKAIAAALLSTLAVLHGLGVCHGDIKPDNVMLCSDGRVVLFDFNTAETGLQPGRAGCAASMSLRSGLSVPACTMLHASPERLRGEPADLADDIFSCCCSLYEAFQGTHPFQRMTALEALREALVPERPPALTGRQWRLLSQGLSFVASERPDAEELARAFTGNDSGRFERIRRYCRKLLSSHPRLAKNGAIPASP